MVFEHEISKYYDEIFRFCFHHVGSRQAAEDICQDTFLSYIEHARSHPFQGRNRSFLYTIARNKCIDYYRKKQPVCSDGFEDQADESIQASMEEIEMRELLSHIDEELREVIILRYFQSLKYREIAVIMDISVSKAKLLVNKALGMLQKEVEP